MDDHEMAAMLNLTTVAQDAVVQGRTAAQLLMQILEPGGDTPDLQPVVLPTRLILRESTAPPPPSAERPADLSPDGGR
jgi:DNA-binding LacI/PurR family transcriptional regulator